MRPISLSLELLKKELRLQRNNAMFALVVVLLGIIGLLSIKQANPAITSFSADDIRDALFMLVLIPALVIILPLMVGSTAAASERSLGVWSWQLALPISLKRVLLHKAIVVAILCAILAGMLPYFLQLFNPSKEHSLLHLFRNTWPGWFGILCGAIGFYSGALARDDYHGLLISALPLGLMLLIMGLADPFLTVSPVFWIGPIWEEWALAARLLLLALLLVVFAGRLLRRHGQPRRWQVVKQAALFFPMVFVLTLWNIKTERPPILSNENLFTPRPTSTRYSDLKLLPKYPIAHSFSQQEFKSRGYFSTLIHIDEKTSPRSRFVTGMAGRGYERADSLNAGRGAIFLIGQDRRVREFSHAAGSLYGHTSEGSWIWIKYGSADEAICGPYGLTISKLLLPDSWFDALRKFMDFIPAGSAYEDVGEERWKLEQVATDNDQIVLVHRYHFLWKNAKQDIPESLTPQHREKTALGTFNSLADGMVGYSLESGNVAVLFGNETGSTFTAILKPRQVDYEFEIQGWLPGEITALSDDLKWASSRLSPGGTGAPQELVIGPVMKSPEPVETPYTHWILPTRQADDDGSVMIRSQWFPWQLPIITQNGDDHTLISYRKTAPVSLNKVQVDQHFPVEYGLVILNLQTGEETYSPTPLPWPAEATLKLQGSSAASWSEHAFAWPEYKWHHPSESIAAILGNYIGFTNLADGIWQNYDLPFHYALVPDIQTGTFLTDKEFIATDGATIWGVQIPAPK